MQLLNATDPASGKIKQILAIQWGVIFARAFPEGDTKASREARLSHASVVLGHDIASFNDLTMAEAAKLRRAYDKRT